MLRDRGLARSPPAWSSISQARIEHRSGQHRGNEGGQCRPNLAETNGNALRLAENTMQSSEQCARHRSLRPSQPEKLPGGLDVPLAARASGGT